MRTRLKIYSIAAVSIVLLVMLFFLEKVIFFIAIFATATLFSVMLMFLRPAKYVGLELVTSSTILIGVVYGPTIGAIYGMVMLMVHLIVGRYYIGAYLFWVMPEYIILGILAGVMKTDVVGSAGIIFVAAMNLINMALTFLAESDRAGKEVSYVIGNVAFNVILILQFLDPILNFIT